MDLSRAPLFLHALRRDGYISSICRECQTLVATKPNEIDLRQWENDHVCTGLNVGNLLHPENVH